MMSLLESWMLFGQSAEDGSLLFETVEQSAAVDSDGVGFGDGAKRGQYTGHNYQYVRVPKKRRKSERQPEPTPEPVAEIPAPRAAPPAPVRELIAEVIALAAAPVVIPEPPQALAATIQAYIPPAPSALVIRPAPPAEIAAAVDQLRERWRVDDDELMELLAILQFEEAY